MEHAKGAHGKGYGKGGKGGKGNKGGVVDSMSTYRVRLHKPDGAARLGITLVGQADAPCITALAHGCIAANSGMLLVGQKLYAVNGTRPAAQHGPRCLPRCLYVGWHRPAAAPGRLTSQTMCCACTRSGVAVQEHESATKMLRAAVGTSVGGSVGLRALVEPRMLACDGNRALNDDVEVVSCLALRDDVLSRANRRLSPAAACVRTSACGAYALQCCKNTASP